MSAFALSLALLLAFIAASWVLLPRVWARLIIGVSRFRAGLSSKHIGVDQIRWHYLQGNGERPTLLLLHGFGADTSCWLPIAPLLRPHLSLLIPDLPGFGESEPPEHLEFDIDTQAERLERFLTKLGVERCIVAGNSMGGYLAAALAAREPDRVRALWLLAPLGVRAVRPGAVLSDIDAGNLDQLQIESVNQFRQVVLPTMYSTHPDLPGPLIRAMAHAAMTRKHETPRMLREARFESEPLESIATRIEVPVLLQWGEDDQVVNPAGINILQRAFGNATAALTTDCGHLPMLERPIESARLFIRFAETQNLLWIDDTTGHPR